ncbi:MAG: site-2 protease family protein [Myxococcota bacterium]|nr:site-2 protease family protein [Myxococcota bacterium]
MGTEAEAEGGLVSLRFGEYFGIELRLHWTFLALGAWMGLTVLGQTGSLLVAAHWLITLGSIFACVALHEYGHALAARHYGIGTLEITLLPIGGVARLERLPEDPKQELWIALAGPATNYALAAILLVLHLLSGGSLASLFSFGLFEGSLLATLLQVNLIMGLFNLLPALPMDGGRVLRALLSLRMPALKATGIATSLARMLAAGMVIYGLLRGGLMLAIIGGFVWFTARSEYQNAVLLERAKANRRKRGPGFGLHGQPGQRDSSGQPSGEWVQPEVRKPGPKGFTLHKRDGKSY